MNIRLPKISISFPTERNALGDNLAQDFFRYGPRNAEMPDWSQTIMGDQDKYTGYMYGAITRRANKVAWLATYNLMTKASDPIMAAAKKSKTDVTHPYLDLIDSSPTFANDAFWREIQTFVDLKGDYYLMAIRGSLAASVGTIKEFKLLNPYDITVVYDADNYNIIGYTETRGATYREIDPSMIIPIRTLNPFNRKKPWAVADAAQDAQFTLKETSQQMRTTTRRNRKYPGVVLLGGGGVALDPKQVENFKSRLTGNANGAGDQPMFVTADSVKGGGLNWNDMQVDIRKSAVDVINEIQLNALIAVTGTSKTKLGIEQSGVTRDTAAIQDDLFVSDHGMPALQLIIDALNQDYKNSYPDDYKKNGYLLYIDSPLKEDKEAELTDVTNRTNTFDLYQLLIDKGYDEQTAADYASGEKPLVDLGPPSNPPKPDPVIVPPVPPEQDPKIEPPISTKAAHDHEHDVPPVVRNKVDLTSDTVIQQAEGALKNAVLNIEHLVVNAVLNKVTKNAFDSTSDIIDDSDEKAAEQKLEQALASFYEVVIPLNANGVMSRRTQEFGKQGAFSMDAEVNSYIKLTATRAAESHIDTVLGDILDTVKATEERLVQGELKKIVPKPGQSPEDVLALARSQALDGVGREQVAAAIRTEYSDTISKTRATTIARTETNRAFNRAQFEADREFLAQNFLTGKAYKQWITRSDDPCPICIGLAGRPPIPFDQDFAQVGDVLKGNYEKTDGSTGVRQMQVGFEDIQAGNAHPNCQCAYQLIIE